MSTKKSTAKPRSKKQNRYSFDFRLRAVKLYLEEGYSAEMVAEELGIGRSTISTWVKHYREEGEAGLESHHPVMSAPKRKINPSVKTKVVELKKEDPQRGVRRISQLLRRQHLMKGMRLLDHLIDSMRLFDHPLGSGCADCF